MVLFGNRDWKAYFRLFNEDQLRSLRAVDVFDELIVFLRIFIAFCGSDVLLMENFRWVWRTWLCLFFLVSFTFSLIYTVTVHWTDWITILDALSVSGIAFQGMIKMYGALSRVSYFQEKYTGVRAMHMRNSKHPENNYVLLKCVLLILYIFKTFLVLYAIGGFGLFAVPLYEIVIMHRKMLILPLELPFVDPTTDMGFLLTIAYHIMLVVFAVAGILAADMAIMIIVLHVIGLVDVYKNTLKKLDQMLEMPDRDDEAIHDKVREICLMHREILKWEEDLDEIYHATVFVQVLTSVLCLSLSLFLIYVKKDITRAMYLVATFFQLTEFCLLGTALTWKNEHALEAIYGTKWYLLDQSDKSRLLFVLHRSQHPVEMTIGGLALLNMETFVGIMKTIYSYFTMLITFLE